MELPRHRVAWRYAATMLTRSSASQFSEPPLPLQVRHSFQLFPGVRINVGSRGVSASFAVRRGIPDGFAGDHPTAMYRPGPPSLPTTSSSAPAYRPSAGMREIGSASVETLTSDSLVDFRDMIVAARGQKVQVEGDLAAATTELASLEGELDRRARSLLRWFYRRRIAALSGELLPAAATEKERLDGWMAATRIDVEFETSDAARRAYGALVRAFDALRGSAAIWDVTSDREADRFRERTSALRTVDRRPVELSFAASDLLRFDGQALRFGNVNGEDILLYPGVALMPRADGMFALIDLRDLSVSFNLQNFIEDEAVPADAVVVGHTWAKVNKDGTPDRRFSSNYQIPICAYGRLVFTTGSGVTEEYKFSRADAAEAFAASFEAYKDALAGG